MISALRGFALLGLLLSNEAPARQTPARDVTTPQSVTGTAGLSGVVINDVTNRPIRRALVTISSAVSHVSLAAITDETGTFAFTDLPADR